jgi:hypothetical protein
MQIEYIELWYAVAELTRLEKNRLLVNWVEQMRQATMILCQRKDWMFFIMPFWCVGGKKKI